MLDSFFCTFFLNIFTSYFVDTSIVELRMHQYMYNINYVHIIIVHCISICEYSSTIPLSPWLYYVVVLGYHFPSVMVLVALFL